LLVTGVGLVVAMALPAWAAEEPKEPGKPDHPNCWGTVVSEVATTTHTRGNYSSLFQARANPHCPGPNEPG
jgi:hypothetical protein